METTSQDSISARPAARRVKVVEVNNLVTHFPGNLEPTLHNVNLTVHEGEIMVTRARARRVPVGIGSWV